MSRFLTKCSKITIVAQACVVRTLCLLAALHKALRMAATPYVLSILRAAQSSI